MYGRRDAISPPRSVRPGRACAENSFQNKSHVARPRWPARFRVLSRANMLDIDAPCVLEPHSPIAPWATDVILKRVLKEVVSSDRAPAPAGPYSQAIRVGDVVYVAGQGGFDPATGRLGATIEEQTEQVLRNIEAILDAAGASLADCVKATVHLSDLSLFGRFNVVYERLVPEPRPARTTVGSELIGIDVEIDVVAVIGAGGRAAITHSS